MQPFPDRRIAARMGVSGDANPSDVLIRRDSRHPGSSIMSWPISARNFCVGVVSACRGANFLSGDGAVARGVRLPRVSRASLDLPLARLAAFFAEPCPCSESAETVP